MQVSEYPRGYLFYEFLKVITGLIFTASFIFFLDAADWLIGLSLGFLLLFLFYLIKLVIRWKTKIYLDHEQIIAKHWLEKKILFENLDKITLRYYSTKRSGDDGWYNLQLKANNITVTIDSQVDNFESILQQLMHHPQIQKLQLDQTTKINLKSLNL